MKACSVSRHDVGNWFPQPRGGGSNKSEQGTAATANRERPEGIEDARHHKEHASADSFVHCNVQKNRHWRVPCDVVHLQCLLGAPGSPSQQSPAHFYLTLPRAVAGTNFPRRVGSLSKPS